MSFKDEIEKIDGFAACNLAEFAACNLAEPSPGDLERVYAAYKQCWTQRHQLIIALKHIGSLQGSVDKIALLVQQEIISKIAKAAIDSMGEAK